MTDLAAAMTDALDVAQKITTLCRRQGIDIPGFEIRVDPDQEVQASWMPAGFERTDAIFKTRDLVEAVFAIDEWEIVTQGATEWLRHTKEVDGVPVEFVIFTT